ncbi:MAG: hypothetical protein L0H25_05860 [Micrococcales bacterium]|nr:hypothetical protein [Micrococcales bacterium]
MQFEVDVTAVETAVRQLSDALSVASRIGAARRLDLVETALPGWAASRAAAEAGQAWTRIEVALALQLGGQADALVEAAQGYQEIEAVTVRALGSGR